MMGCVFDMTQMLQAAANVIPRGVYVCGNTTTTSGLTVTLTKEGGGSGHYALEAGALVLADQGIYVIVHSTGNLGELEVLRMCVYVHVYSDTRLSSALLCTRVKVFTVGWHSCVN